jgi:GNAT superfamily N-acetyltransferase
MWLREVSVRNGWNDFLNVPKVIYHDDTEYVPHIKQDLARILGPKNSLLKEGGCRLWVAGEKNNLTGRIAAFYTKSKKIGGIGFFECTDDQTLANKLFHVAFQYLIDHGYSIVEAPVNFGERDSYWGLMVKGFKQASYQENYNPPYYQKLFEDYGFEKGIIQTTQELNPESFNIKKFKPLADRIIQNPEFELVHINKHQLDKFAADFVHIYNKAWSQHEHFIALTLDQVMKLMKAMKPILREELVWFTYANEEPVAFYVSVIDVNQIFKKINGNLNWWGKIKFLYYKKRIKIDRIRGIIFGVIPEYQGRGLASGMMMKIFEVFEKDKYLKSTELAWVGDFNPRMLRLLSDLGATETKVHITYHKKI